MLLALDVAVVAGHWAITKLDFDDVISRLPMVSCMRKFCVNGHNRFTNPQLHRNKIQSMGLFFGVLAVQVRGVVANSLSHLYITLALLILLVCFFQCAACFCTFGISMGDFGGFL